jgi:hypothetical protein
MEQPKVATTEQKQDILTRLRERMVQFQDDMDITAWAIRSLEQDLQTGDTIDEKQTDA